TAGHAALQEPPALIEEHGSGHGGSEPHESPRVMTAPLAILAAFAVLLGLVGTPAWPWFQQFLNMRTAVLDLHQFAEDGFFQLMILSSVLVFAGLGLGWFLYGSKPVEHAADPDPLERWQPGVFRTLARAFYVDQVYDRTILLWARASAAIAAWLDRWVWSGALQVFSALGTGLGWLDLSFDRFVVNQGFDEGCEGVAGSGRWLARLQTGRIQDYLRIMGIALVALAFLLLWGRKG
ncbi:MAG TPA: hypothetical protein VGR96_17750, partial [Acidobacteriaceae bacterium]|nr:hypothetical protein [Acidobacteriaceae bacterium]